MNGKQAKRLRKKALESHEDGATSYRDYYPPQYDIIYYVDEEGVEHEDTPLATRKTRNGLPRYLNECARRDYKDLKDPARVGRREITGR